MTDVRLIHGSALHIPLDDESVQCVVTSPPYWGLRQYAGEQREVWGGEPGCAHEWGAERIVATGNAPSVRSTLTTNSGRGPMPGNKYEASQTASASQGAFCACGAWYGALGLEPTPEMYVEHMVAIFREVRRVLRKDGTLWLNLGDSYAGSTMTGGNNGINASGGEGGFKQQRQFNKPRADLGDLKPKDLVGIPWMVAFALRADGWYLRSDIIWHKPNPMPESVTDRPTKAHEYVFLLAKSGRYYYDADAIREPHAPGSLEHNQRYMDASRSYAAKYRDTPGQSAQTNAAMMPSNPAGRNKRTVWTIATRPYKGAHFATFPEDLVEPCVLAGTSPKACGVCGAPWERVTERGPGLPRERDESRNVPPGAGSDGRNNISGKAHAEWKAANPDRFLGWRSTCEHEDDSGACVVLDPFNGSGTTGQVAVRLGRSYVGVDISKEYLDKQAGRRIYDVQMEAAL